VSAGQKLQHSSSVYIVFDWLERGGVGSASDL